MSRPDPDGWRFYFEWERESTTRDSTDSIITDSISHHGTDETTKALESDFDGKDEKLDAVEDNSKRTSTIVTATGIETDSNTYPPLVREVEPPHYGGNTVIGNNEEGGTSATKASPPATSVIATNIVDNSNNDNNTSLAVERRPVKETCHSDVLTAEQWDLTSKSREATSAQAREQKHVTNLVVLGILTLIALIVAIIVVVVLGFGDKTNGAPDYDNDIVSNKARQSITTSTPTISSYPTSSPTFSWRNR